MAYSELVKTIMITLDSLNRHFLSAYGGPVEMAALSDLAKDGSTFAKHFTGSAPCMPARREMLTGTLELRHRGWGPLEPFDRPLPQLLAEKDIPSMLITDHYHYFENGGENYHVDFTGYELIRGHENDNWKTSPFETEPISPHSHTRPSHERSRRTFARAEDFPAARTFAAAEAWVDENTDSSEFFLYIDEFDPHEPFFAPEGYLRRVDDSGYDGPRLEWPKYGTWQAGEQELDHIRNRYAAKLRFLDDLLRSFFAKLQDQGMYDETTIIVTTDHGHYLGDHDKIGKPASDNWNTLFHIPMVVKPAGSLGSAPGRIVESLTTSADLCATVADIHGLDYDTGLYGTSFLPVLQGRAEKSRDYVLYGYFGGQLSYCDGERTFFKSPVPENAPLNLYTTRLTTHPGRTETLQELFRRSEDKELGVFLEDVDYPVIKLPVPKEANVSWCADEYMPDTLYDLADDQGQEHPIRDAALIAGYREKLADAMRKERFPSEQFTRLGLPPIA